MKVCVVGAGPCGLTTVKQLLDEGHEVVCFDKNADIGGLWLRDDEDCSQMAADQMKAYDTLMLTISMKLMAYSDHPQRRVFYSRRQYFGYLNDYAARFGLREHIRFHSEVTDIERTAHAWTVTARRAGAEYQERFDAVAVCSGPFKTPNRAVAGLEGFTGEVVHSSQYRNNERFRDKRVLIVGLAESGADIVREVSDVAKTCTLSIRSYTFLLPRVSQRTRTTDQGTVRAHHHEMYRRATHQPLPYESFWEAGGLGKTLFLTMSVFYGIATAILGALRTVRRSHNAIAGDTNPLGEPVDPAKIDVATLDNAENWDLIRRWNCRSHPEGSWSQRGIFAKNVSFIPAIVAGRVALNDTGIERSEGATVFFRDGTAAEFDAVILCTGFTNEALSLGDLQVKDGNVRNLYKHFLHPDHRGTVAFIGFIRPFSGGIPVCAEMQARYFARVCSGKQRLPADLDQIVAREKQWEEYWTSLSPRQTESIPSQILYLDALAREVGCLVPMSRMVFSPRLFAQLWFGSFNPSCYRIVGPHNRGAAALEDLYSEPVDDWLNGVLRFALLQLMPSFVHPKHLFGGRVPRQPHPALTTRAPMATALGPEHLADQRSAP